MKELQPNILDDYQHRVEELISHHHDEAGFPRMEDYHVEKDELSSYLFEYQAIRDSEGSQQTQLTVYGILVFIPVLVCTAIGEANLPWGRWSLLVSIGMGLILALLVKSIRRMVSQLKLNHLRNEHPNEADYAEAVCRYQKQE